MADAPATASPVYGADKVSWSTVFAYGVPADVLLISSLVMGLIFSTSWVWDAVSDPLVGYLSDRTRSRFGRRRTWMAASVVPISATFVMIFAPPTGLSAPGLVVWMAAARFARRWAHRRGRACPVPVGDEPWNTGVAATGGRPQGSPLRSPVESKGCGHVRRCRVQPAMG